MYANSEYEKHTKGTSFPTPLTRFDDIEPSGAESNSFEGISDGRVWKLSSTSLGS